MLHPFIPQGLTNLSSILNYYKSKKPRFEIKPDAKEKFRWHIYMSSDIVASSSQGYATRELCLDNVKSIGRHIAELEKEGKLI